MSARTFTDGELRVLLAEASREGARQALAELGLEEKGAAEDIRDVRALLGAYRQIRKGFLQQLGKALCVALLAVIASILWTKGWRP